MEILKNLVDAIRRKRPRLMQEGWSLLHDNAPSHTAGKTMTFIQRNNIELLPHPPYSPDLAPCDFFLFPKLKEILRGKSYKTDNDLITASGNALKQLTKESLLPVFEKWCDRMRKCVEKQGDYVEK